jgi:hypothetical protein
MGRRRRPDAARERAPRRVDRARRKKFFTEGLHLLASLD